VFDLAAFDLAVRHCCRLFWQACAWRLAAAAVGKGRSPRRR